MDFIRRGSFVNDRTGSRKEPVYMQAWHIVTVRNIRIKLIENLVIQPYWREMNSRYNFETKREMEPLIVLWFQTVDFDILTECLYGLCVRQNREYLA
jgi:hypothetical protein